MMSKTRVCLGMEDMVTDMEPPGIPRDSIHLNPVHIRLNRVTLLKAIPLLRVVTLLKAIPLLRVVILLKVIPGVILLKVIPVAILLLTIQGMVAWGQCLLGVQQQLQLLLVRTTSLTVATTCLMEATICLMVVFPMDMVHTLVAASSSSTVGSSSMVASSSMARVSMESLEESMECLRNGSKTSLSPQDRLNDLTIQLETRVALNKSYILL